MDNNYYFYYYNVASKIHYIHSQHRQFIKIPPDPTPLVHHALQRQRIVGWLVDITYYDYILVKCTPPLFTSWICPCDHRLASCVIVSRFRAALDLDIYPYMNLIRPRCAERAKPGRGKSVLIMHIGFFACFHGISLERSRFSKIATFFFLPL